jgi:hypothetical protein
MTRRSHRMQKHKFSVTDLSILFMETALGPPMHEILCLEVSRPGRTRMHYMTHRSHQMQNQKIGETSPSTLFMETALGPPKHENIVSTIMHYVTRRSH